MDKDRNASGPQPGIVVIGAAIIDTLVCPAEPDVFEAGSFAAESISMSPGADALNEATILAKLGKRVRLETVIGDDEAGRYLLEHCARCGIELPKDAVRGECVTGINVVLVRGDGSRSFLTNANGTLRKLRLSDIHMPFPESAGIICSSLLLLLIAVFKKDRLRLQSKKDYALIIFTGAVMAVHWTTFFQSIQVSSVAIGTITFSTFPLFLTFLEPVVFHEKLKMLCFFSFS